MIYNKITRYIFSSVAGILFFITISIHGQDLTDFPVGNWISKENPQWIIHTESGLKLNINDPTGRPVYNLHIESIGSVGREIKVKLFKIEKLEINEEESADQLERIKNSSEESENPESESPEDFNNIPPSLTELPNFWVKGAGYWIIFDSKIMSVRVIRIEGKNSKEITFDRK